MTTLFIGSLAGTACSLYYYNNLLKLGQTVVPFDPGYFHATTLAERVEIRLRRSPSPRKVNQVAERLVDICSRNQFDYIFVMAENFLSWETLEQMRQVSRRPPIISFHSHDNLFSPGICKPADFERTIAAYDFAFTTKSQNVARYQKLGQKNAHFIASAYEPSVHRPINDGLYSKAAFDVTFIGTYDQSRDAVLNAAGWDHLHVWGDRWKKFGDYNRYASRITDHAVYYLEFADILSHSKISLGILREEAQDRHTQRTFEIPACGALQLAPRNDEICGFFDEDQEIVCYGSPEELADKIKYYLAHEKVRARIARRGHRACVDGKHTYLDRLRAMFKCMTPSSSSKSLRHLG